MRLGNYCFSEQTLDVSQLNFVLIQFTRDRDSSSETESRQALLLHTTGRGGPLPHPCREQPSMEHVDESGQHHRRARGGALRGAIDGKLQVCGAGPRVCYVRRS